jgi:hypothetical protein
MAGAGYKLFNTGDVLLASEVNTYLMQQTVMVFDDAAARTTALTGVVAEGMVSYLKSTNVVEVYDGSNWVSSDDPNAIQNTIVDAKGDLITATAADTPARLAVGSNGDTLVADSAESTGLRWTENYAAGKNKIINGDFNINQRAFTSSTSSNVYTFDRWKNYASDGTVTCTAETFTLGTAPVAGYEAANFYRVVTTGQTATSAGANVGQHIEDVRTFANQTVTVSFWAKAASGTPKIAAEFRQNFGSGGSPSSGVGTYAGQATLSTSWARYSITVALPSISGKTIGTTANTSNLLLLLWVSAGTDLNSRTGSLGIQSNTFDIWGVQVESGSVATAFQTATGTLQGELAACQRYYLRLTSTDAYSTYANGAAYVSTSAQITVINGTRMRVQPSSVEFTTLGLYDGTNAIVAVTNVVLSNTGDSALTVICDVASGLTAFRPYVLLSNNNSAGYIGFSAEL